ncbi:hypothetical protein [Dickeya dadantii]|uniref:hypothetical protein n=1 Tax=Dickeya dadantii TaxID=204038 RepID=UPI001C0B2ED5|nr:hypothetical protein [Dickeya dadantii]QWT42263.1 hypothetical protein KNV89_07205 [Dickeya dadantii]
MLTANKDKNKDMIVIQPSKIGSGISGSSHIHFQLVYKIIENQPGDSVGLVYRRGGEAPRLWGHRPAGSRVFTGLNAAFADTASKLAVAATSVLTPWRIHSLELVAAVPTVMPHLCVDSPAAPIACGLTARLCRTRLRENMT